MRIRRPGVKNKDDKDNLTTEGTEECRFPDSCYLWGETSGTHKYGNVIEQEKRRNGGERSGTDSAESALRKCFSSSSVPPFLLFNAVFSRTEEIHLPSSVSSVPCVVNFFSLSVFFPLSVVHLFISRVRTHSP